MNQKWEVCQKQEEKILELVKQTKLSPLLASILINRNIEKIEEIKLFLNPTRNDFHDPFLMPDMDKAVERILKAIQEKEKVIIYGDYDVDGITSITVLKSFLKDREVQVEAYIPNRLEEGYGLNKPAIEKIAKERVYFNDNSRLWYFWNRRNRVC